MAIRTERPKVYDEKTDEYLGTFYEEDDEIRDDKGNTVESMDLLMNGKASRLFFSPKTLKTLTVAELMEIHDKAAEDERYQAAIDAEVEQRAKKLAASGGSTSSTRQKYGTGPKQTGTKHIREWARSVGADVPDRGAVPKEIKAAYETEDAERAMAWARKNNAVVAGFEERSAVAAVSKVKAKAKPTKEEMLTFHNTAHGTKLTKLSDDQEAKAYEDLTAAA